MLRDSPQIYSYSAWQADWHGFILLLSVTVTYM